MTTKKLQTVDVKGGQYATVSTRIKEFREDCPNGLIETKPEILDDGRVMFTARILRDKANLNSGESTGHSTGSLKGQKEFEKLETIAIGRALAILGYLASGDVASHEEMEEFYAFKKGKITNAVEAMNNCKNMEELRKFWAELGSLRAEPEVIAAKEELKSKFS